mmetsp:Transcript_20928/g.54414  ORF Transcript_20928/g.54414 Transcript_20928/m.54414 type:complete len:227 (-) Transcript_20928:717-1397(-)
MYRNVASEPLANTLEPIPKADLAVELGVPPSAPALRLPCGVVVVEARPDDRRGVEALDPLPSLAGVVTAARRDCCIVFSTPASRTVATWDSTNSPCCGLVRKYSRPLTVPLCIPSGRSSLIPSHSPFSKSTGPLKRTTPILPLAWTRSPMSGIPPAAAAATGVVAGRDVPRAEVGVEEALGLPPPRPGVLGRVPAAAVLPTVVVTPAAPPSRPAPARLNEASASCS